VHRQTEHPNNRKNKYGVPGSIILSHYILNTYGINAIQQYQKQPTRSSALCTEVHRQTEHPNNRKNKYGIPSSIILSHYNLNTNEINAIQQYQK
jgi:hypothetical protein